MAAAAHCVELILGKVVAKQRIWFEICGELLNPSDELLHIISDHIVKCRIVLAIGEVFFAGQIEHDSFCDTSAQNEGHVRITLCNINSF